MRLARLSLFLLSALVLVLLPLFGQAPMSKRVVAYNIDARYDAKDHSLDAVETLTYHNYTGQPLDKFPFHLYLNAFQRRSSFNEEQRVRAEGFRAGFSTWDKKHEGSEEVKKFEVISMSDGKHLLTFPQPQDVTSKMQFIRPDDDNVNDTTVFEVQLPQPIPPDGEVTFRITFHDKFPEVVARTGYKRDFILAGQWFPKVGVWWQGQWNCHQFHQNTEFFADFGVYNVNVTVPENFVFGATGTLVSEKKNGDGTKTMTYHAEDVHDFAWTADPHYKIVEGDYTNSMGLTTHIRILMQPANMDSAPRYLNIAENTLKKFDEWYGPYPYSTLTIVDPPNGGIQAGGMEYPTFITAGTTWWMPNGLLMPEMVTEHEFGHQYWYAMVATNEFEDAWLDEGINSYVEVKVLDDLYGKHTSIMSMYGLTAGDRGLQRMSYLGSTDLDPMTRKGWEFASSASYSNVSYGKTATVLLTLEGIIGEDKVQQAIRTWFQRYKFTHPTADDFMKTVNEVAGQDLSWYWDQAVKGTAVLDYRILSAKSMNNNWSTKSLFGKKKDTPYLTTVVVHRKGDFVMPVQLEVKFDNGEVVHETWDGKDRWHRFNWEKKAQLVSAELDYKHQVLLDKDQFNNSYVVEANPQATRKITNYWLIAVQWFSQMLAWLT
jgi:hypothetical protein